MNQENNPTANKQKEATKAQTVSRTAAAAEGFNLKEYKNLIPKTVAEIAEINARGRKLLVKKRYSRKDPYSIPTPREKTKEELIEEAAQRQKEIKEYSESIIYSNYYFDERHEYRHVVLPKPLARWLPRNKLLTDTEWQALGVTQSSGWEHYMIYAPEPHILLFRRERDYLEKRGLAPKPEQQVENRKEDVSAIKPEPKKDNEEGDSFALNQEGDKRNSSD